MNKLLMYLILFTFNIVSHSQTLISRYSEFEPNYFISNFGSNEFGQVKFKISFKYDLLFDTAVSNKNKLFFAYNQLSFWDLWDKSSPMKDVNYSPMLMYMYNIQAEDSYKLKLTKIISSVIHQSNGKNDTLNRSINKLFFRLRFGNKFPNNNNRFHLSSLTFFPEAWIWFAVSKDNKDIAKYQGYGQLITSLGFDWGQKSKLTPIRIESILIPANKGLSYYINFVCNPFKKFHKYTWVPNLYAQYWNGFGESLLNYDNRFFGFKRQSTFRLGLQFRTK